MDYLEKSIPSFIVLQTSNSKQIKYIIKYADDYLIKALTEIFYNVLNSGIILDENARDILQKDINILKKLAKKQKIAIKKIEIIKFGIPVISLILPSVIKQIVKS